VHIPDAWLVVDRLKEFIILQQNHVKFEEPFEQQTFSQPFFFQPLFLYILMIIMWWIRRLSITIVFFDPYIHTYIIERPEVRKGYG